MSKRVTLDRIRRYIALAIAVNVTIFALAFFGMTTLVLATVANAGVRPS